MEWSYLELGAVELVAADPRGVLVEATSQRGRSVMRLAPVGETFVVEAVTQRAPREYGQPPPPPPFERTSLGAKKERLGWPNGATTIEWHTNLTGWDDRFAIAFDERGFSVIDAETDRIVRVMFPKDALRWERVPPIASVAHVWIGVAGGVVAIPTAMLETLAAGPVDVTLVHHYPRRDPDARLPCVFLWSLGSGRAMVEIGDGKGGAKEPKLTIALPDPALAKYAPLVLVDELYPWCYAGVEIAGRERISIVDLAARRRLAAKVAVARAKDPTGVAKAPSRLRSPRRSTEELGRLVAAIVADPADDAHRAVLADLLLEIGDPSAEAIARLRAGKVSPATVKEALGPLGPYLTKVVHAGGLPVEATVARDAPDDLDHPTELAAACADFRLALIRTLHSQPGRRASPAIYARLVGAPNATALRRVDVSDQTAIDALIAAKRDQLEHLEYVDFAEAEWMARLATSTFDRVTTVHTVVGLAHVQPLVNRLVRDKSKFFARARRGLVLDETRGRTVELLRALAEVWATLPLAALTIGGVTIERGGAISGDDAKLVAVARRAFAGGSAIRS